MKKYVIFIRFLCYYVHQNVLNVVKSVDFSMEIPRFIVCCMMSEPLSLNKLYYRLYTVWVKNSYDNKCFGGLFFLNPSRVLAGFKYLVEYYGNYQRIIMNNNDLMMSILGQPYSYSKLYSSICWPIAVLFTCLCRLFRTEDGDISSVQLKCIKRPQL